MTNYFDTPPVDFLDYGDHTGMKALFTQAGLPQIADEYYCHDRETEIPAMQKLA